MVYIHELLVSLTFILSFGVLMGSENSKTVMKDPAVSYLLQMDFSNVTSNELTPNNEITSPRAPARDVSSGKPQVRKDLETGTTTKYEAEAVSNSDLEIKSTDKSGPEALRNNDPTELNVMQNELEASRNNDPETFNVKNEIQAIYYLEAKKPNVKHEPEAFSNNSIMTDINTKVPETVSKTFETASVPTKKPEAVIQKFKMKTVPTNMPEVVSNNFTKNNTKYVGKGLSNINMNKSEALSDSDYRMPNLKHEPEAISKIPEMTNVTTNVPEAANSSSKMTSVTTNEPEVVSNNESEIANVNKNITESVGKGETETPDIFILENEIPVDIAGIHVQTLQAKSIKHQNVLTNFTTSQPKETEGPLTYKPKFPRPPSTKTPKTTKRVAHSKPARKSFAKEERDIEKIVTVEGMAPSSSDLSLMCLILNLIMIIFTEDVRIF